MDQQCTIMRQRIVEAVKVNPTHLHEAYITDGAKMTTGRMAG